MKKKDLSKTRAKSILELKSQANKIRKKLVDLKMQASLGKLKNTQEPKIVRKDLAQLLTILREKQIS